MPERDLTQLSAVKGLAAWIGKGSHALVVMVLRSEDAAFWIAPDISPASGVAAVDAALPELLQVASVEREAEQRKAIEKRRKDLERQGRGKRGE